MAVPRPWQNPLLGVVEIQVVCYSGGQGPVTVEVVASELSPAARFARLAVAARN
jgi:hypothetical protein